LVALIFEKPRQAISKQKVADRDGIKKEEDRNMRFATSDGWAGNGNVRTKH
jgi:hypothetical protein